MVVRTQSNGHDNLGLCVGAANARRYFHRNVGMVELHLGDLFIQCKLPDRFWDGQPEIHDPRLCEWLKFKLMQERRNAAPIALRMVQSGANTFTVQPKALAEKNYIRTASA